MADPLDLDTIEKRQAMAYEELLRVTGMCHHAKNVRGGPPNPPRCSIPADVDRDTDLIIGESLDNVKALLAEVRALRERLAAAEALSESRRVTLLAKSDELVAEWKRAETAEALVRELAPVVKVAKAVSLRPTAALFRELEDLTLGLSPAARKEIEG